MKHTLYLSMAKDDRHAVYSYVLADYKGIETSGTFAAVGRRRHDDLYCGHVALQRALRIAAKLDGVVTLHVQIDDTMMQLAFGLVGVESPKHPALAATTGRLLKRFSSHELGASDFDDSDATPVEVTAADNALDALENYRTIRGRWQLLRERLFEPSKIIR